MPSPLQADVPAWALLVVDGAESAAAGRAGEPNAEQAVVLRGLRQRPEFNGRFGQVLGVVDTSKVDAKRCVVRMGGAKRGGG
jgi:hypothetical protein